MESFYEVSPTVTVTDDAHANGYLLEEQTKNGTERAEVSFKLFGPLTIFSYLTPISGRTDWYRAIMRAFFQYSRRYRYQLTVQDIVDAVQTEMQQEYTIETCKND